MHPATPALPQGFRCTGDGAAMEMMGSKRMAWPALAPSKDVVA